MVLFTSMLTAATASSYFPLNHKIYGEKKIKIFKKKIEKEKL